MSSLSVQPTRAASARTSRTMVSPTTWAGLPLPVRDFQEREVAQDEQHGVVVRRERPASGGSHQDPQRVLDHLQSRRQLGNEIPFAQPESSAYRFAVIGGTPITVKLQRVLDLRAPRWLRLAGRLLVPAGDICGSHLPQSRGRAHDRPVSHQGHRSRGIDRGSGALAARRPEPAAADGHRRSQPRISRPWRL